MGRNRIKEEVKEEVVAVEVPVIEVDEEVPSAFTLKDLVAFVAGLVIGGVLMMLFI